MMFFIDDEWLVNLSGGDVTGHVILLLHLPLLKNESMVFLESID